MTVCIAAICEMHVIMCAADRMLTTTDVEFEPSMPKIRPLTTSIIIMTAGDSAVHAELQQAVAEVVFKRINEEPDNWWSIRDVAALYAKAYTSAKLNRAEGAILAPLGLNRDTFIARQHLMASEVAVSITKEMLNIDIPYISAIVSGIDKTGAHIYIVRNEEVSCQDSVGFASIGIGSRHAESQFMFARHTRHSTAADTLLRVFSAKKRSEVAPGVGEDTDMYVIGPRIGTGVPLREEIVKDIDKIYQEFVDKEKEIQADAQESVSQYVAELERRTVQQKQKPGDTSEVNGV